MPAVKEFEEELMELCIKYNRRSPGSNRMKNENETGAEQELQIGKLSFLEKAVVAALDYKPLSLTSIYESLDEESRKHYPIAQVSVALVQLCMKNLAKQAGAGYYTRS